MGVWDTQSGGGENNSVLTVADGARLQTFVSGAPAAPPVALLHGGPGLWDYLGTLAALLDHTYRVHRYDQRGCGRSSGPADYRISTFVADLDQLRTAWQHQRWAVLGHSWGATLALSYAAAHPDRVSALILCASVGPGTAWKRAYRAAAARRLTGAERRRLAHLAGTSRDADDEVEFRVLSWKPDHGDRRNAERWARQDAAAPFTVNLEANRRLGREQDALDMPALAATVTAPTLIIHGDRDPRPAWSPASLTTALPRARFELVTGAGHHPWREAPQQVAQLVGAFLERHG